MWVSNTLESGFFCQPWWERFPAPMPRLWWNCVPPTDDTRLTANLSFDVAEGLMKAAHAVTLPRTAGLAEQPSQRPPRRCPLRVFRWSSGARASFFGCHWTRTESTRPPGIEGKPFCCEVGGRGSGQPPPPMGVRWLGGLPPGPPRQIFGGRC